MQAPVISRKADFATTADCALPSPPPAFSRTAAPVRFKLLALGLISGGLLWLCHFPVAWGFLGWVALIPLLPLLEAPAPGWWRYLCAWLGGTVYFWPAISWMTVADDRMVACWALLSFYCSLYFPLAIFLVRRLQRGTGLPLVLTFPAVWTALEFFRSYFGTGFSWYLLAHTQHRALHVIQIADLGGAFAVSFLVAAVNVIVFLGLTRLARARRFFGLPEIKSGQCRANYAIQLCCVLMTLCATLAYGAWRLSYDEFETGPRIALLQGNLDQRLRLAVHVSAEAQSKVRAAYMDLCREASLLNPRPQLIVWPETSYPVVWVNVAPQIDVNHLDSNFRNDLAVERETVLMVGPLAQTNVLLGLNTLVLGETKDQEQRFNSALLVDSQGNGVQRYDKIHRVPFGEYVPLRDYVPLMKWFAPYDFDYSIGCGDGLPRLKLGNYRFGVLICYEDTDPFMARDYGVTTADGPPADFLLNISNDGWFDGSCEHEEHLAISRFRAIETRRALARSVNMGISAAIDSNGRVIAPVKQTVPTAGGTPVWAVPDGNAPRADLAAENWHEYKQTEGILVLDMPIDRRTSLYAAWGDWLPYSCWVLIGGGLGWAWWRRRSGVPSLT